MRPAFQRFGRLGALGLLIAVVLSASGQPAPDAGSWDRYRVLVERNIFVRDRRAPQEDRPVSPPPVITVDTDGYLVLTGVAQRDRGIAFIEDTRTGQTARVRTGDAIGKGKVVKITLSHIEYQRDGRIVKIEIGSNLAGSTVSNMPVTTSPATEPAAAIDGNGPPSTAPSGAADILERMRQRRQQQTNR